MRLLSASVLCGVYLLGSLSGLHAQERTTDPLVVATLVDIVKDKMQKVERRLNASKKLGELKVKDEAAVKAVTALLVEMWPVTIKEDRVWVIATVINETGNAGRKEYEEQIKASEREALGTTPRVDTLAKALSAMGAAESAVPTLRKFLTLSSARVDGWSGGKGSGQQHFRVNIQPLRGKALEHLEVMRTPTAVTAISDFILDPDIGSQAIKALGKIKDTETVPKLAAALIKAQSVGQRSDLAAALGAIGSAKGLSALKVAEAVEEDEKCLIAIRAAIKAIEANGKK